MTIHTAVITISQNSVANAVLISLQTKWNIPNRANFYFLSNTSIKGLFCLCSIFE